MKGSDTGDDLKVRTEPPDYSQIKIDADSARILHYLNNLDINTLYATSRELLEATELSNTTQVCYRLDEHLIPGGLACERPYAEIEGFEEGDEWHGPREFSASSWTQHWVEEHGSSPLPVSEEVNQLRRDLDGELERVEEQVEDVAESLDQLNQQVEALSGKLGGVKSRGSDRSDRIDQLSARVEAVEGAGEIAEQVEQVEQSVGQLARRLDQVERAVPDQDALNSRIESLQADLADLQRELADRKQRMQKRDDAYDERLSSLEDTQESMRSRMSALKSQLDELRDWADSSLLSRLIGR